MGGWNDESARRGPGRWDPGGRGQGGEGKGAADGGRALTPLAVTPDGSKLAYGGMRGGEILVETCDAAK